MLWNIQGISKRLYIKITSLNIISSIASISFLLINNIYQTYHQITIFGSRKKHYLSQFKDAQRKMQNIKNETESWYTMTLLNISDISCRWNICRTFPPFNWYDICYFHNWQHLTDTKYFVWNIILKPEVRCNYRDGSLSWKMFNSIK